jgi:hypothetical protein
MPDLAPPEAIDLISKLLVVCPSERLHIEDVKAHALFEGIDFNSLWSQEAPID